MKHRSNAYRGPRFSTADRSRLLRTGYGKLRRDEIAHRGHLEREESAACASCRSHPRQRTAASDPRTTSGGNPSPRSSAPLALPRERSRSRSLQRPPLRTSGRPRAGCSACGPPSSTTMFRAVPSVTAAGRRSSHVPEEIQLIGRLPSPYSRHLAVGGIEPQRRCEPHFHEVGRLEDRVRHAG